MTASVHTHLRPLQDPKALTKALEKVATALGKDLVERSKDVRIEPMLQADHAAEVKSNRVGLSYLDWRNLFCDQVAASWVLCTVFVRTLEDRGFLPHRIAGPGAADRLAQFRQQFRFLTERDYLRHIFDALSLMPAGNEVFGAEHAPLWKLSPSQGALAELLDVLRATGDDDTLVYTFARATNDDESFDRDGASTRYLGDLYQDLNEGVRKRYALLQTPDFVEHFILDQTLTPAMKERGLDVTVLDPTCGSGHFLLGAYDRLFDAKMAAAPGLPAAEHAKSALGQIYGIDLNPYAAAIARFRLLLAYLDKSGVTSLSAVSDSLPIHIYVGDSLIDGRELQLTLGDSLAKDGKSAEDAGFRTGIGSLYDPATDELLKTTRFDVVVANPPYITEKDAAKRETIRGLYKGAKGKFALSAPFVERIFQLADDQEGGGWTGQITSNSFMKREFGKSLIEEVMPSIDLSLIIDTSGAYIPGYGTPTVLLFGRNRKPLTSQVNVVMGNRGEPSTPEDASKGKVWTSITEHYAESEYEDDYITQAKVERKKLEQHPWSLSGGGAAELKELLEERAETSLSNLVNSIGFGSFTGLDDVFLLPSSSGPAGYLEQKRLRPMISGDIVRDWNVSSGEVALTPYEQDATPTTFQSSSKWGRYLWPFRRCAEAVMSFGGRTRKENGDVWWHWYRWVAEKYRTPLSITFAEIASHNHFVLDRGGKVFKQTAPIIKLPDDVTEDDHLALLGYLNSSVVCFYLKQVCMNKGLDQKEPWGSRFVFDGSKVKTIPLPSSLKYFRSLAAEMDLLVAQSAELIPSNVLENEALPKTQHFAIAFIAFKEKQKRMVAIQERIDWTAYVAFGLCVDEVFENSAFEALLPNERLVDYLEAERTESSGWFERHGRMPPNINAKPEKIVFLNELVSKNPMLKILELPEYKRRWPPFDWDAAVKQACEAFLLDAAEAQQKSERDDPKPCSVRELAQRLSSNEKVNAVAEVLTGNASFDLEALLGELMQKEAIVSSTSQLYTKTGIERRRLWEKTWELQRKEDAGEDVGDIPVPPKYGQTDFENKGVVWKLRGKLDVPKERFIAYPSATPPAGAQGKAGLVFGWAGWNHFEQLQAATSLWQAEWDQHGQKVLRKSDRAQREETLGSEAVTDEALLADADARMKLLPILQTMVDLLPWVRQWHNDDGETAPQFEAYVSEECRKVDMSLDEVHLYRLPAKAKKKKAVRAKKPKVVLTVEMVMAQLQAFDEGDGANQTAMAKALGVTGAVLKKMLTSLEEEGKVRLVKKRPALWSAVKDEAAA